MEQQLLSELGQVRAGYDSPSRQDRITLLDRDWETNAARSV